MWSWLVLINGYRSDRGHFYGHYSKIQNENGLVRSGLLPISHSPGLQVPSYVTPVSSDDAFGTYELHAPSSIFISFFSHFLFWIYQLCHVVVFFFSFLIFPLQKRIWANLRSVLLTCHWLEEHFETTWPAFHGRIQWRTI